MLQIAAAYVIDLLIGDPKQLTHPVVVIGKSIQVLEKILRRIFRPRIAGIFLTFLVVAGTYLVTWVTLKLLYMVSFYLGFAVEVWFLSTTFATRSLGSAAREIFDLLDQRNLTGAREKTGWIVGRDTGNLDEGEVTRATVETVAENIVDGITAPLFYALIGGLPLAMAYKAVNTLDSMVGYKNEKYLEFGWASARLDDVCNYLPARFTGAILMIVFLFTGRSFKKAFQTVLTDAPKHPSPNSGISEAAVAGALGIRLGGTNLYGGVPSFRSYMGENLNPLTKNHIMETIKIMYLTSVIFLISGLLVKYGFQTLFIK